MYIYNIYVLILFYKWFLWTSARPSSHPRSCLGDCAVVRVWGEWVGVRCIMARSCRQDVYAIAQHIIPFVLSEIVPVAIWCAVTLIYGPNTKMIVMMLIDLWKHDLSSVSDWFAKAHVYISAYV